MSENNATFGCPKRGWTLGVLTDEDLRVESAGLPQGLRFHLSRCPECAALANSMGEVERTLTSMAGSELPADLLERANAAARSASAIAALNGSTLDPVLADDLEDLLIARASLRRDWRAWLSPAGAALAASIALLFGIALGSVLFPPKALSGSLHSNGGVPGPYRAPSAPAEVLHPSANTEAQLAAGPQEGLPEGSQDHSKGMKGDAIDDLLNRTVGNEGIHAWQPRNLLSSPTEPPRR